MKDESQHPASPSRGRRPDEPADQPRAAGAAAPDCDDEDDGEAPRTPLAGIGQGLRRLRMQRGLRQYEAAEAAGVTKAMLSAYETGKRRPSLKTLDSLLTAMDADLGDLHRALMSHRREVSYLAGDAAVPRRWDIGEPELEYASQPPDGAGRWPGPVDVYDLLGLREPLPAEEEQALAEMLHGFLKLLRFMHRGFAGGGRRSRGPFDGG
jgi:transcriptional regulator with XRE-family HTH domain